MVTAQERARVGNADTLTVDQSETFNGVFHFSYFLLICLMAVKKALKSEGLIVSCHKVEPL